MTDQQFNLSEIRQRGEEDLYFFAKAILGYDWLVPHIHYPICQVLMDDSLTRKKFVLPRGWLKTTVCTIAWPIWMACKNPNVRVLLAQNTMKNAGKKLGSIRSQFEKNDLLRALYPDILPGKESTWNVDAACLTRSASFPESTFEAAGIRTQVTSRHYDVIIEDDTVAPDLDELNEEGSIIPSVEDVAQAIGWHRLVPPLLNNPSVDKIVVVGTRWYENDLMSWIAANEPRYHVTERSCLENEEGKADRKGVITYPERFSRDVLEELEVSVGPYLFSCLYLNHPVRSGDMIFKPEWITYYETCPPKQSMAVYTTVDPASDAELTKGKNTDYSVVMTCGKDLISGQIYVLDYFRARCNPGELASAIFEHVVRWRPIEVGYEDVAFQKTMEYWLRELMRKENIFFILRPVKYGRKSKETRISALQPMFANRVISIRTYMKDFVSELMTFPRGAHDDIIDALSMQLQMWRITAMKQSEQKRNLNDPLSFENAVEELRKRQRGLQDSIILDPMTFSGGRVDAL